VITIWDSEERPYGMTTNAFTSVSVDPVLVLVCLSEPVNSYHRVVEERRFSISIFTEDAQHISSSCTHLGSSMLSDREWLCEDAG
jgi:flavin reductase (DIM6/NTAB) family NADH-FMN oxidoreductase RutF